jgi:hypothetical protein
LGQWDYKKQFNCLGWFEFEFISKEDVMVSAKNAQIVAL